MQLAAGVFEVSFDGTCGACGITTFDGAHDGGVLACRGCHRGLVLELVDGEEQLRPRLEHGTRQPLVARCGRECTMERGVGRAVAGETRRPGELVDRCVERAQIVVGVSGSGEGCGLAFDGDAEVDHVVELADARPQLLEPSLGGQAELAHHRAPGGSAQRVDVPQRLEHRQSLEHGLSADAELLGELALRRQAGTDGELATLDEGAEVLGDLVGSAVRAERRQHWSEE